MRFKYRRERKLTFLESSRLKFGSVKCKIVRAVDGLVIEAFESRRQARMARAKVAQAAGLDPRDTRIVRA